MRLDLFYITKFLIAFFANREMKFFFPFSISQVCYLFLFIFFSSKRHGDVIAYSAALAVIISEQT